MSNKDVFYHNSFITELKQSWRHQIGQLIRIAVGQFGGEFFGDCACAKTIVTYSRHFARETKMVVNYNVYIIDGSDGEVSLSNNSTGMWFLSMRRCCLVPLIISIFVLTAS